MKPEVLFHNFPVHYVPLLKKAAQAVLKANAGKRDEDRCSMLNAGSWGKSSLRVSGCAVSPSFVQREETRQTLNFLNVKLLRIEINFILIPDAEIRALNKKYRNVDRVTDVISFRLSKNPLSGDIYIARGRSKKQAAEMKHSWKLELCYLVLHGALHLFDYTDYTPRERKKMFAVQDKLFKQVQDK
jgi:probable rRNA maturation factor